jgi:hypothetical protein
VQSLEREQSELAEYLFGDLPADELDRLVGSFGELLARIRQQIASSGTDNG